MSLLITFVASLLMTYGLLTYGKLTPPTHRCSHHNPTPTCGGIAFIITALFHGYTHGISSIYVIGSLCLAIIGFLDDIHDMSYKIRLSVQVLCSMALILGGYLIEIPLIPAHLPSVMVFTALLTLLVFLFSINGANFVDGLNGLLTMSMIVCLLFAPIWINQDASITSFYYHLIAALLGFLVFNFPKARIFMGDTGSTFLGYTLMFSALSSQKVPASLSATALFNKTFVFTLLPLAFLGFDVIFTLIRRAIAGCRLTEAHRDHLFHVLFDKGFGHVFVTLTYGTLTLMMGGLTFLCFKEIMSFVQLLGIYALLQGVFVYGVFHIKPRACHAL